MIKPEDILHFWFVETTEKQWWQKNSEFDHLIYNKFRKTHNQTVAGELAYWRDQATGRLAEIIILDQFSRNIFRDNAQAFAYDNMALALAQEAIRVGADQELNIRHKSFLYMPFMHSESNIIHEQAMTLFNQQGLESNLEFEKKHKVIIDQFGRYPHRNALLNRTSTPAEQKFLLQPNSSF